MTRRQKTKTTEFEDPVVTVFRKHGVLRNTTDIHGMRLRRLAVLEDVLKMAVDATRTAIRWTKQDRKKDPHARKNASRELLERVIQNARAPKPPKKRTRAK
jgi:hypothetical protein